MIGSLTQTTTVHMLDPTLFVITAQIGATLVSFTSI